MNIKNKDSLRECGTLTLRIGLVAVFYYFGFSQMFNAQNWVFFLPEWTANLPLTQVNIIVMNGVLEVLFATLLLIGLWTRAAATLLAIHLFGITIAMGFTPTGARDAGLTFAAAALALLGPDKWTLDNYLERKKRK